MAGAAKEKSRLLLFAHFIFTTNEFIFTIKEYQINVFFIEENWEIAVILITKIVCLLYLSFDNIFKTFQNVNLYV